MEYFQEYFIEYFTFENLAKDINVEHDPNIFEWLLKYILLMED